MYTLGYTQVASPSSAQLDAFKDYLGVNGTATDVMLSAILKEAMLRVGDAHDTTILPGTCILAVTDREEKDGDTITLFGTPSGITSVKDGSGTVLDYTFDSGSRAIILDAYTKSAVIAYTTAASILSDSLTTEIWDYARGKYDQK